MMRYVLFGEDAPGAIELRLAVRAAHRARLDQLQSEGRLVLAGPMPAIDARDSGPAGFFGSLIIAEFASLQDARDWLAADPYVTEGVYARTSVRPFKQVYPQ